MALEDGEIVKKASTQALFLLLQDMLPHMSSSALSLPLGEPGSEPKRPYVLATSFYGVKPCRDISGPPRKPQPAATASEDLASFILANSKVSSGPEASSSKSLSTASKVFIDLLIKVAEKRRDRIPIKWEVDLWRNLVLDYMEKVIYTYCHCIEAHCSRGLFV